MTSFLVFLLANIFSLEASALRFGDIKRLIRNNDIRSVDELVEALPQDFLDHYVVLHHTQGSPQSAQPGLPRIIAFGADAKFILAFNGKEPGYHSIDIMELREDTSNYEFRQILFARDRRRISLEHNKPRQDCLSCHGDSGRAIWDISAFQPEVVPEDSLDPFLGNKFKVSRYSRLPNRTSNREFGELLAEHNRRRWVKQLSSKELLPFRDEILNALEELP